MQFVKLEGDAVFCFAPQAAFPNGELLVELIESGYFDFTNRLLNMTRSTTCTCDACRAIGGLDLKFVVHNGTFIVDRDEDGRLDLAGPDVILLHRLLKNTIIEAGGPSSYGFFTDPCLTGVSTELRLIGLLTNSERSGLRSGLRGSATRTSTAVVFLQPPGMSA